MKYASANAFRTALDTRMRTEASRLCVSADRLLVRLHAVAPDQWIVKGGVALELRLGDQARTTMDLDLVRQEGGDAASEDLIAIQEVEFGDFFVFVIERIE